ncbi:hypothetical protein DPMN_036629 [Dreissena polymorpha]|uniref:Reverse transcriptase domain-containing protein n=1 Tax=Dreissena polymorpha TaxID=45954 RepID=A0A9D4MBW6_DREPO|nr:hypothetical protein DPMN_036629 [Dreissena polymorpha]
MKSSTDQKRNGIQWTLFKQLKDIDFADDLALLSHTQQQMPRSTNMVASNSVKLGLNIIRVFKTDASNDIPITVQGEALEEVDSFHISSAFGTIMQERTIEPASVKHEQPSIS